MKTFWLWYGYRNLETVQEDTGLERELREAHNNPQVEVK